VAYLVAKGATRSPDPSSEESNRKALDVVLLALLAFLAVNVYRKRDQAEPPAWMGKLQEATPSFSFKLGFFLLGVFPTDIVTSVTVGARLARNGDPWWHVLGFVALTLFLLAIPAILVVVMGRRAQVFLPQVRDWMNTHAWIVSELVIALFVGIEINSLASG
jgi:threonine/homoserine/homoserine lactone efflux protein